MQKAVFEEPEVKVITKLKPILVSAAVAAQLLSFSERKLRDLTKAGKIPAKIVDGRVLYSPAALRRWASAPANGTEQTGETGDGSDHKTPERHA